MNTVTKQLFLTFGLSVILVGTTQPGEHKRSESDSAKLFLPNIGSSLESEEPKTQESLEEDLNGRPRLTKQEQAELRKNMPEHAQIVLGSNPYPREPFKKEKKKINPLIAEGLIKNSSRRKWAGCLSCLEK